MKPKTIKSANVSYDELVVECADCGDYCADEGGYQMLMSGPNPVDGFSIVTCENPNCEQVWKMPKNVYPVIVFRKRRKR